MGKLVLPVLLLLSGCLSAKKRVETHLERGSLDRACEAAEDDPALLADVHAELLGALGLTVAMEPVPIEAFGVPPRGYGEEWLLVGLGQARAPGVADRVKLSVDFDGWSPCPGCDDAWMRERMTPPPPEGEPPEVKVTVHAGTGAFAGLGRAFADIGRVIGAATLLPAAALLDTALLMPTLASGRSSDLKPYGLTKLTYDALLGNGISLSSGATANPSTTVQAAEVLDTGITCRGDLPCTSLVVFTGSGPPPTLATLNVTAAAGECSATAVAELPVDSAQTPEEAIRLAFPSEGRLVSLEVP